MACVAFMIDQNGVLNVVSFRLGSHKGWQGPDTIGNGSLVPGSPVAVFRQSPTVYFYCGRYSS
jgi:hypothetical protein